MEEIRWRGGAVGNERMNHSFFLKDRYLLMALWVEGKGTVRSFSTNRHKAVSRIELRFIGRRS